ncbi:DUF7472 family protein [Halovivax limisalsi]|uniref:DUF7472 family protein n=1 Tax=Halovivax limisalsi TaxID=1453760 RepID=UPI001FFCB514|nr:hypothetical protein [Halovivax limisalsi]
MFDRESLIEMAAAVVCVLVILGGLLFVGSTYGDGQFLGEEGATMLIAVIVASILFATMVGVALAYTVSEPENGASA